MAANTAQLIGALPTGTVTFLYTDVEGSTKRWEQHPGEMKAAVEVHDAILRKAIEANGGVVFRTMGDAFCAAFSTAPQAMIAALDAQRTLFAYDWGVALGPVRVRMALHTGLGEVRDGDYVGQHLNRIARLLAAGHGGQTLLTQAVYELVYDNMPAGTSLEDLGEKRLRDLQRPEHVFQIVVADLPSQFPPLKTLDVRPHNLPTQTTPFIGREKVLDAACDLLSSPDVRLLTLTGPGGTGKTRLGLEIARSSVADMEEGVFFVPLASVSDPQLVGPAIAQALGLADTSGSRESLIDFLREKQILLMFDNFEQVMGAATLLADLLSGAARLKMIVTSREALHVYGETEFPVPPLVLPDPRHLPPVDQLTQYEAVRLFIDRARSVKPDFTVTNENAPAVAEICYRLDGLPLAIELAAARIKLLPPAVILSKLQSRLRLLTGGARDLPARQQTLRGAIEWGYDLLNPGERRLFRSLAVFVGGCTLEAADRVCGEWLAEDDPSIDLLDGLGSLLDKSFLKQEADEDDVRFFMLETIREFALEKLDEFGDKEVLQRRHADYYKGLVEEAAQTMRRGNRKHWLNSLESELDNIRAVLQMSLDNAVASAQYAETGLRMIGGLEDFWTLRGHVYEGERWGEAMLGATAGRTALRARAMHATGYTAFIGSDLQMARKWFEMALDIYRELNDPAGIAYSIHMLGACVAFMEDPAVGRALSIQGMEIFRSMPILDNWGLSQAGMALGVLTLLQGDYAKSLELLEESEKFGRASGDMYMVAQVRNYLGDIARMQCDYPRAEAMYREALPIYEDVGSRTDLPAILHNMAYVSLALGRQQEALSQFSEAVALQKELGSKPGILEGLAGLASVAGAQGKPEYAARLLGAVAAARERLGGQMWPAEQVEFERSLASVRDQMDEATFEKTWSAGRNMGFDEALRYALETRVD